MKFQWKTFCASEMQVWFFKVKLLLQSTNVVGLRKHKHKCAKGYKNSEYERKKLLQSYKKKKSLK
jgi:hypothetical protein